MSPRQRRLLIILAVAGVAAFLPAFLSAYTLGLATRFLVFSILALSLDLLWGYGGVVSFGHAMFFGLGAYAVAISLNYVGGVGGTLLALLLGMAVPALLGLFLGMFLFYSKVSGVYFGIVTLALTVVFETIAIVESRLHGRPGWSVRLRHPDHLAARHRRGRAVGCAQPLLRRPAGPGRGVPGGTLDHRIVLRGGHQGHPR